MEGCISMGYGQMGIGGDQCMPFTCVSDTAKRRQLWPGAGGILRLTYQCSWCRLYPSQILQGSDLHCLSSQLQAVAHLHKSSLSKKSQKQLKCSLSDAPSSAISVPSEMMKEKEMGLECHWYRDDWIWMSTARRVWATRRQAQSVSSSLSWSMRWGPLSCMQLVDNDTVSDISNSMCSSCLMSFCSFWRSWRLSSRPPTRKDRRYG